MFLNFMSFAQIFFNFRPVYFFCKYSASTLFISF